MKAVKLKSLITFLAVLSSISISALADQGPKAGSKGAAGGEQYSPAFHNGNDCPLCKIKAEGNRDKLKGGPKAVSGDDRKAPAQAGTGENTKNY